MTNLTPLPYPRLPCPLIKGCKTQWQRYQNGTRLVALIPLLRIQLFLENNLLVKVAWKKIVTNHLTVFRLEPIHTEPCVKMGARPCPLQSSRLLRETSPFHRGIPNEAFLAGCWNLLQESRRPYLCTSMVVDGS